MTQDSATHLLVLTNLPDKASALELAKSLVDKRLAACVNVLDGCTSLYRWRGEVQTDREIPVLIKTSAERFAVLQQEILALHPYELPEVIALPVDRGLDAYLSWVDTELDILR
ncbi:MAG: divalent cation tolerance protein CutA [Burkholderiales bacterium]|nr:divalent cation tolerance protein CutA [Burkholderiales bacterium]